MDLPEGWTFDMRPCPHCGTMISQLASSCRKCRKEVVPAVVETEEETGFLERVALPVGRDPLAIAAGYLGLFSLMPFFGVVSIVVSVLALRSLKRHPNRHGRGRAWFGLVLGVLTSLIYLPVFGLALFQGLVARGR